LDLPQLFVFVFVFLFVLVLVLLFLFVLVLVLVLLFLFVLLFLRVLLLLVLGWKRYHVTAGRPQSSVACDNANRISELPRTRMCTRAAGCAVQTDLMAFTPGAA
jgi:hypothetical protein